MSDVLRELFGPALEPGYADAARRRSGSRPGSARLGRAGRIAVLVCAGFLLAVAYRQVVASEPDTARARADLVADVAARRAEADAHQREADGLRDEVSRRRAAALADDPELARLRALEARTGLARVTGDGAVVRVADARVEVDPVTGRSTGDERGRVFDYDLQQIANALWRAGAEAVAINGQRLTATSTIRAAGGAVLVDFRPVTSPYEVSAIGPGGLDRRFADSATGKRFKRIAEVYRMEYAVRGQRALTLPAAGEPQLRYASPPPSASPSGSPSSGGGR